MRQRRIKNLDEKLSRLSSYIVENPEALKGKWGEVTLEIGCGKGKFINEMSAKFAERDFVAIEGHGSVILRALQKYHDDISSGRRTDNLRFIYKYVRDIRDIFEAGELRGIYLNFSDPWPKDRHYKRRLTYRDYLFGYREVVRQGGFIEFKTDNDDLFDFTLGEIHDIGLEIADMSRDLHGAASGGYAKEAALVTTEYEERFIERGKNINYVRIGL